MSGRQVRVVHLWAVVALALIQWLALIVKPTLAPAATNVSGDITTNATWTKIGSPYQVDRSVRVLTGVALTIEPGVEVRFKENTQLEVAGTLQAVGTASQPITFTGASKTPGSWQGISFDGSKQTPAVGTLRYITVEYGGSGSNGGNVYVSGGQVSISHSTVRNSAANGVFGWGDGTADIADTSFTGNAGYAVWLTDVSLKPVLARLSASGNGSDAVGIGGNGSITGADTWEFTRLPYVVTRNISMNPDAALTIEPGVEVRFKENTQLEVAGTLRAVGTASQPITFTGASKIPGSWQGISFHGSGQTPAVGTFSYVTIEYGGSGANGGNVYISGGQVSISHSIIRHSNGSGVFLWSGASGSVIETSQIIDNHNFGVYTVDPGPTKTVLAPNNWWGTANGPTVETGCNPGGTGSKVSAGVAFRPFLTSADADPGSVAPSDTRILTLTPQRWFAPANGITPIYIAITLRDGAGHPVPERQVRLISSLGRVTDGGFTDVTGKTFAIMRSSSVGDAEIVAVLDSQNRCEFARSDVAKVTFTPVDTAGVLTANAEAPYMNGNIEIIPEPIVRGVPTTLRAKLTNPNPFPIVVDATFEFAQLGIGLAFGPVGEVRNKSIAANSEALIEVQWTPAISGRYCVKLEYTIQSAFGVRPATGGGRAQHNLNMYPGGNNVLVRANLSGGSGQAQRNLKVSPGPFLDQHTKDTIKKAERSTDAISDSQFVLSLFKDREGIPTGLIQDQLFENILDFIYDTYGAASCALAGDPNCGGWKGPRLQLPGDTIGHLLEDPPSQNYRSLITVQPIPFTPLQPGPSMPAARAAALNALMEASLNMIAQLFAAVVSNDRYAGAAAARDLEWASRQAVAYLSYLRESGQAMTRAADSFDAFFEELRNEGISDVYLTAEAYRAYQERLRTQGFTAKEIEAARLIGFTGEAIEAMRQARLARDPEQVAGSVLEGWRTLAAAFRTAGNALLAPPGFGISVRGGRTSGKSGRIAVASQSSVDHSLVRLFETSATIPVGNPLSQRSTIELRPRPVNLPPDWTVTVTPRTVTLDPGEQTTVTITIRPGTSLVQGTTPRVAVEGYSADQLVGGVVLDVAAPRYAPFDGHQLHASLPFGRR